MVTWRGSGKQKESPCHTVGRPPGWQGWRTVCRVSWMFISQRDGAADFGKKRQPCARRCPPLPRPPQSALSLPRDAPHAAGGGTGSAGTGLGAASCQVPRPAPASSSGLWEQIFADRGKDQSRGWGDSEGWLGEAGACLGEACGSHRGETALWDDTVMVGPDPEPPAQPQPAQRGERVVTETEAPASGSSVTSSARQPPPRTPGARTRPDCCWGTWANALLPAPTRQAHCP